MSGDGSGSPLQVFQSEETGGGHNEESAAIFHERQQQLELLASESHEHFASPINFNSPTHDTDGPPSPLVPAKSDPFNFALSAAFPGDSSSTSLFMDEETVDPVTNKHAARHLLFATYIPISEPLLSTQELNKRAVVLCGVGVTRARVERIVGKVTDDVEHYFRLLAGITTPILPDADRLQRFRLLPAFDQRMLASTCEAILRSTLKSTSVAAAAASGGSVANPGTHYYPACTQLVFVCELLEVCGGIQQILELLVDVIACESDRSAPPLPEDLCLPVIGLLHKYYPCLLLSQQNTTVVFEK